ncbi:MAG: minor capsid protein [Hyphomicrobiales bacterium]
MTGCAVTDRLEHAIVRCRWALAADQYGLTILDRFSFDSAGRRLKLKADIAYRSFQLHHLLQCKQQRRADSTHERSTDRYVWRTVRDERVRLTHRANEGHMFSWNDPPPTGHPGEQPNCRCWAEPYVPGETEFGAFDITTDLGPGGQRWADSDFVRHYFRGNGRRVDLRDIGHLKEIAEHYAYGVSTAGAFRYLADQIASKARQIGLGRVDYDFRASYSFDDVQFSHGGGSVRGVFIGYVRAHGDVFRIEGDATFNFSDAFTDPLDGDRFLGVPFDLPDAKPYEISGSWAAHFRAEVNVDPAASLYVDWNIERQRKSAIAC